jgi:hypothetical protein
MAANRAEFSVHIKSTSDNSGVEKSIGSHKSLHEAIELLKQGAGDALGPIGELAHFMANPYILAIAGATLAVKMLVERHQQLREELQKNITATREMHDQFEANFNTAVQTVTESLAAFHRTFAHAGETQNEFASHLADQTALINEQAAAVTSLAAARLALYQANIQGAELSGQITGPQEQYEETQARIEARQQEEQAERDSHTGAVAAQREAASGANAAATAADNEARSPNRTAERVRNEALVLNQQDEVERRQKVAKDLADKLDAHNAGQGVDRITDEPGYQAMKAKLADLQRQAAQPGLSMAQASVPAAEARAIQETITKYEELKNAQADVVKAKQKLSEYKIKAADYEEETKQLGARAVQLRIFAETTNLAAAAAERLNHAIESAHAAPDATNDEAVRQRRHNQLMERHQRGQLTPDETEELIGMGSAHPGTDLATARQRVKQIETHVRRFEGGHASPEEVAELRRLVDRLVGIAENIQATTVQRHQADNLESRIAALERNAAHTNDRMGVGGNMPQ